MITDGDFYSYKKQREGYSAELTACIEETVENILLNPSSPRRPGMLLGRVQAGKTFAYCGITSLAIDNGFEVVIVLTKGTKFLLSQTYKRLRSEFDYFIEDDLLEVFDIMRVNKLSGYMLSKKIIICVKKEDDNLNKLIHLFNEHHELLKRRVLIIDDEADFCGISFKRKRGEIKVGTIMRQISDFRLMLNKVDYLLVTATPFSLFLQPEGYDQEITGPLAPTRPAFTTLVPVHDKYIGGDQFFCLDNDKSESIFQDIQELVPADELRLLRTVDSATLDPRYKIDGIDSMWDGILNFIVGGCIRRVQQREAGEQIKKYSFIVHTETQKVRHSWQETIINSCLNNYIQIEESNPTSFRSIIESYYDYFKYSIDKLGSVNIPALDKVYNEVISSLKLGCIEVVKVNSDTDTELLIDEASGQLRLSSPFMIFVGGSILDRGISIDNLIGMYYGRDPRTFQMDSVLQHMRCFGPRPLNDMAVTRIYSTQRIYDTLYSLHATENALWDSIERNGIDCPINFIEQSLNDLIPCSPNKILFSDVISIRAGKRFLPIGFHVKDPSILKKVTMRADGIIYRMFEVNDSNKAEVIEASIGEVIKLLKIIWDGFILEEGNKLTALDIVAICTQLINSSSYKKINIIYRENRSVGRLTGDGRFLSSPDSGSGSKSELAIARELGEDKPTLILLRQNGEQEKGWSGEAFYWPVLISQNTARTTIFSRA